MARGEPRPAARGGARDAAGDPVRGAAQSGTAGVLARIADAGRRVVRLLGPNGVLIATIAIGATIALAFAWAFGEVYEGVAEGGDLERLDTPVLEWAIAHRTPALETWATIYTDIGGTTVMPILAALAAGILALAWRSWTPVVLLAGAAAGSLLMTVGGKDLFDRARPPLADAVPPYEHSPSFPSGHALNATVIAGVVAYLIVLRATRTVTRVLAITAAAVFAITIGLSRVYLGHHWLTDVIAAWLIGLGWLAFVITAHRVVRLLRAPHPDRTTEP